MQHETLSNGAWADMPFPKYGRLGQTNRKALLKELCRFRELYCGAFLDGNLDTLAALNRYLDHFAHVN